MANLTQLLQEWVSAELISSTQAASIERYEQAKPARHWVLYGILAVGVTVLAIGVISLIAANWSEIPNWAKLGADLLVLAALALGIYRLHGSGSLVLFEVGIVFFAALILASIGLIAQIYHTGGDLYQALLLWLVMLLPLALCTQRAPLPHVWLMVFMGAVISLVDAKSDDWFGSSDDQVMLSLLFAAPAILFILGKLALALLPTHAFARVFNFWLAVLGCIAVVTMDIGSWGWMPLVFSYPILIGLTALFAIALALVVVTDSPSATHRKALLLLFAVYVVAVFATRLSLESSLVAATFSILLASLCAFYFALCGSRRLFNFFALLVAIRFLIVYFDALGGLATTGIGLIISGVIILSLAWAWYKHHGRLQTLVEGIRL
ncbi:DUF2157 domain-containing protein [Simiduia curdlanivorans]|uniref:DUF2157 domain-containing protein n=1 Tax=Simiduia curdlanivorans TaxID=1492769 RepID=A0ABV8V4H9_9GAMM|nr:DUF2157 domain-containing protein [Simiduia curdlanivorans]MDN3637352.1 DUF2157 domain-containing protein [Simiduia curdlanivorans]